jgi:hypothetical protein
MPMHFDRSADYCLCKILGRFIHSRIASFTKFIKVHVFSFALFSRNRAFAVSSFLSVLSVANIFLAAISRQSCLQARVADSSTAGSASRANKAFHRDSTQIAAARLVVGISA